MASLRFIFTLCVCLLLVTFAHAQTASSTPTATSAPASSSAAGSVTASATASATASTTVSTSAAGFSGNISGPPDVLLSVPTLSVGRIELDVDNLQADINLAANVAGLVSINAGVAVGITKVNLTISEVDAELELIVRLGNLVNIVNRVFQSLDLNPLLISALNDVTNITTAVIGAVDGLLGSITQGGTTLNFLVDNLGNIVQEVAGVSSIVGNYLQNMTETASQTLSNGDVEKTYSYSPLSALVDIVFNAAGDILQASVVKASSTATATSSTPAATSTAAVTSAASSAATGT